MSKHARKPGYVEFCGTLVSPRGKQIYEALESGKGLRACADEFGISLGTISGYAKRARRFGIVLRQNKRRVMVAVSNMEGSRGERYEFCGRREVVNAGFSYQTAYAACKGERESAGYLWHFKVEQ